MQALGRHFAFLDKEFLQKFLAIVFPVALMSLINFGVKAVDTLMLGMVGEIQLSAAALANQLSFMFMIFATGVAAGSGVLTAQYWGAGDKRRVREIFAFMYKIIVFLNLAFASIAFFAPHIVLGILTTDQAVIAEGIAYLRIMSLGYIVSGVTTASTVSLRSVGVVKISVAVFSISLLVSATLNFLLIFGHFGFPELGIRGAAIGTVIARFVEVIVLTIYMLRFDKTLELRPRHLFGRLGRRFFAVPEDEQSHAAPNPAGSVASHFMKHGVPVVLNEVTWATAFFILNVIIGRMGREFVAANAIGGLMIQFNGMLIFSVASTMSVIVGNTIGEGRYERARQIATGMLSISFVLGVICAVVIQLIRVPFVNIYELSETARIYALQITNIISVNIIFVSVAIISLMGTLRGGGDAKFVMVVDVIFMCLICIPLGAFTGLVLGWPVWIVFIILRSEDFFKTIVVLWRVPSGKWLKDVTK